MHLTMSFIIALVITTMVCVAQTEVEHVIEKRRSPHRDKSIRLQTKAFCPLSPEIDSFLKQLKGSMQKRISVRRGNIVRYNFLLMCIFTFSSNKNRHQFDKRIHTSLSAVSFSSMLSYIIIHALFR